MSIILGEQLIVNIFMVPFVESLIQGIEIGKWVEIIIVFGEHV
jgi:hypothetical protein